MLRVCNDLTSKGTAVIAIDGRQPVTLGPGLCTEDYGNAIELRNESDYAAPITYRSIFDAVFLTQLGPILIRHFELFSDTTDGQRG